MVAVTMGDLRVVAVTMGDLLVANIIVLDLQVVRETLGGLPRILLLQQPVREAGLLQGLVSHLPLKETELIQHRMSDNLLRGVNRILQTIPI
jgi:hypothetical protein